MAIPNRPTGDVLLLSPGNRKSILGDILGNRRYGTDQAAATDSDRGNKLGVTANENIITDGRLMFVNTIVVAGNRATADIDIFTKAGIADVG